MLSDPDWVPSTTRQADATLNLACHHSLIEKNNVLYPSDISWNFKVCSPGPCSASLLVPCCIPVPHQRRIESLIWQGLQSSCLSCIFHGQSSSCRICEQNLRKRPRHSIIINKQDNTNITGSPGFELHNSLLHKNQEDCAYYIHLIISNVLSPCPCVIIY